MTEEINGFLLTGKSRKWYRRTPRKIKKYLKANNLPFNNITRTENNYEKIFD